MRNSGILTLLRTLRHGPLKRLAPVWLPLGRLFRRAARLGGSRLAVRQMIGDYGPFKLDPHFAFSNFAGWGKGHNEGFAACVEACRGRRCVIDVGAHIGLVTLPAASVLAEGGTVVAFEPAATNRTYLERHSSLNGAGSRVRIEKSLVGAEEREHVPFFERDDATGLNTVVEGVMAEDARRTEVAQISLDVYCARSGLKPDVIKIDVEGAEIGVLEGARRVLLESRPLIFLSVHPRQIALLGRSVGELTALIDASGYDCRHIDGSPVTEFALREYRLTPRHH